MLHQLELVGTALLTVVGLLGATLGVLVICKAEKAKFLYERRQRKKLKKLKEHSELF